MIHLHIQGEEARCCSRQAELQLSSQSRILVGRQTLAVRSSSHQTCTCADLLGRQPCHGTAPHQKAADIAVPAGPELLICAGWAAVLSGMLIAEDQHPPCITED